MLPLLQMHPHAVPPPPPPNNFDPSSSLSSSSSSSSSAPRYHGYDYTGSLFEHDFGNGQLHDASIPQYHHRSFPIRTSQPHPRHIASPASSFPPHQEHRLRRKTPNGTIDAGYDGSPMQFSAGPPPLKHMILPVSTALSPFHPGGQQPMHPLRHVAAAQQLGPAPHGGENRDQSNLNLGAAGWFPQGDIPAGVQPQFPYVAGMHLRQQNPHQGPNQLSNMYQPVMRATEYNVRAFCPPPPPMNDSLPFGHMGWQPAASPWDYRSRGQFPGHPPHFFQPGPHSPSPVAFFDTGYPAPNRPGTALNHQFKTSVPANIDMQNLSLGTHVNTDTLAPPHGPIRQPRFKEKALAQAHRSYVELLAHLQNTRKMNHMKNGTRPESSSKLLMYPKPPKPGPLHTIRDNVAFGNSFGPEFFPANARHVTPFMSGGGHSVDNANGAFAVQNNYLGMQSNLAAHGTVHDGRNRRHSSPYFSGQPLAGSSLVEKISPAASAKSSLELLKSLCEQSEWKWIDGMLLGGCLLYGLELYEDALKWFSRVISLDPSHVEAITNTAATLYCLDRQADAERHWLKAVELRPSYLEAAEHLVGLLYKERSKEAVEIISGVQRALRIRKSDPSSGEIMTSGRAGSQQLGQLNGTGSTGSNTINLAQASDDKFAANSADSSAPGFGSSGYALPGSENGRILALVHAKGTMLYSLKEVDRASEAFEEAMLISVGRCMKGVRDLIHHILTVLSPAGVKAENRGQEPPSLQPLLLPPERARHTAQLVFAGRGELPGLVFVQDGAPKRAAVQTTSNSLLSLAKIFQDSMSSGSADSRPGRRPSGVGDILALYYLSLSLQESPSTANNVGILLAGVQQPIAGPSQQSARTMPQPTMPGIQPGSGLALALSYYHYGLRLDPKHVHLHTNLGSLLKDIGQLDLAINMYEQAVSCDGTFDIALTNLANAVKDRGRVKDAITYYRRAVKANPKFAEAVCGLFTALNSVCDWRGRGGALLEDGRLDRWHVDDDGALEDARKTGTAGGLTRRVVGIVSQQLTDASYWGRHIFQESVVSSLDQKLRHLCEDSNFDLRKALSHWSGESWEGSRFLRLLERATRVMLWKWYHDLYGSDPKPSATYYRPKIPANLSIPTAPTVLPFHTFTCPLDAKDIRRISQRNAMRISCSTLRSPWLPRSLYPPPPPPVPHLNIGYVSSDFNNHPLAHLMQSVFGFHDPKRARAVCYATTASDQSSHRQQIERQAPLFRDVSSWSADKLIEQIVLDEIHILVNLNGYTRGARNEIFAARPAPIQMSFMGFAGTLGAEWCDYILADATAIPPSTLRPWRGNVSIEDVFMDTKHEEDEGWMYSENVVFCRDTFFCCDHAQSCDANERTVTWEEEELRRWKMRKELFPDIADDVVILGNFNQLYKIEPTTFRCWLKILAEVPKAILWLLRFPELGETNLRSTAEAWAGAEVASRLVFTDVAPKSQHISRARVCDLFLDTPECNAHTTAADVLWSSTPLLTLPRYSYKMCSRMAASILKGALPKSAEGEQAAKELIADSEAEYQEAAVRLVGGLSYTMKHNNRIKMKGHGGDSAGKGDEAEKAGLDDIVAYGQGHGRLAEMRKLLWDSKWTCGLFDTRRWVNDVETAYEEAWRRWVAGEGGDIYL